MGYDKNKTKTFTFRISENERDLLRQEASRLDVADSELLRKIIVFCCGKDSPVEYVWMFRIRKNKVRRGSMG